MSYYHRNAMGDAKTRDGFALTADNIDEFTTLCMRMYEEINLVNSILSLEEKQRNPDPNDFLYTPEFIGARIAKLLERYHDTIKRSDTGSEHYLVLYRKLNTELNQVNSDITVALPVALSEAATQADSDRMEKLNNQRIALEDQIVAVLSTEFQEVKECLPKIYYMIIEGVDRTTLETCFMQMKRVLTGQTSAEDAMGALMDQSIKRYNLPSGVYDHLTKSKSKSKSKSKPKRQ